MDWDKVRWHPVGVVTKQRDNHEPGCTCPSWRYCPWKTRPTNPECPTHGERSR
jgi:hypothetical protein